jgi:Cu/Ag efflux protein CusF
MKTCQHVWLVAIALVALVGCQGASTGSSKTGGEKLYDIRGKVVAVDPAKPAITLDHEDIPGLMKAMKMEFSVADSKLLDGIKVGDQVQGQLKKVESGYVVTQLKKQS